jgi:hypothetical protein
VRLLRPLVHGPGPATEGSRKSKSGDARVMLISGKRYILDQAAADARVSIRSCRLEKISIKVG